jgi:hypothetical protein
MELGHDSVCALATIVELINSSPTVTGEESLPDLAALHALVERRAVSEPGRLTADDLAQVHRLRNRLHDVFLPTPARPHG